MTRIRKDYYTLPEAAERSAQPIDDLLWLGEKRHIMLSVYANNWPIVWGDERETSYAPDSLIKIEDPIKPPFDLWQTGHLNLCWYDIHSLRVNRRLIISGVYAEKDGRIFVGDIQKRDHQLHGKMHEFNLELENVFISHEELQRVINGEAGDWECETEVAQITTATIGDQTIHNKHKAEINNVSVSTVEHNNIVRNIPDQNDERGKRESRGDLNLSKDVELEGKIALKPMDAVIDGRSARKAHTQVKRHKWQQKCGELKKKNPKLSLRSIANHMSRLEIADDAKPETIRRNIKLPKS